MHTEPLPFAGAVVKAKQCGQRYVKVLQDWTSCLMALEGGRSVLIGRVTAGTRLAAVGPTVTGTIVVGRGFGFRCGLLPRSVGA